MGPDDLSNLDECETCDHLRGEHMGSYAYVDNGPCNSRGSKYAGKAKKLDQIRGASKAVPHDICQCVQFIPKLKPIVIQPGRPRGNLGTQVTRT